MKKKKKNNRYFRVKELELFPHRKGAGKTRSLSDQRKTEKEACGFWVHSALRNSQASSSLSKKLNRWITMGQGIGGAM